MPELRRPDGTEIHFEVRGPSGPVLVLASYWSWIPDVYEELLEDLSADHRVVVYHLRGTGESSRNGPYDMETDRMDLEAVVDAVGGPAVLLATADASNRSVVLAARRPELVAAVICLGAAPFARDQFEGEEGMVTSDTVVNAFIEMLRRSYRGGMRTFMEATNPQMDEEQLRERVAAQEEFCTPAAAIDRLTGWVEDDPREASREVGDRLWIFGAASVAGPWMPPAEQVKKMTAETLPAAHLEWIEPGPISAPHTTAEAVRRVTAPLRAGAAEERK
jgi:pimeloyl-ACP methyl ester carboxylesterase